MMGGVPCDWLRGDGLRGIRVDEVLPSTSLSYLIPAILDMQPVFETGMNNHSITDLFPRVLASQRAKTVFSLSNAVGTITQVNGRNFSRSFDSTRKYPTNTQV